MKTTKAIKYWSEGFITTSELIDAAKKEGFKLSRQGNTIHAEKNGMPVFGQRI